MVEKEELIRIVTAAQQGDENGAAALYSAFHNDIYYFILKTVSDSELAADLTQDTFMEILQTIGQLKEPAAFVTWSRQIAYHRCTVHLEVSHLYELCHETDFTGTGSENDDGMVQYDLRFETPVTMGVSSYEYWEMTMIYDPKTEEFSFNCDYYVNLTRRRAEPKDVILSKNEAWSGEGTCDFCFRSDAIHVFSLDIEKMTDTGIQGVLTVTSNGNLEHTSAFTGRGYLTETGASYEIRLTEPITGTVWMSERTVEIFWMHYDKDEDTLNIQDITYAASCVRGGS